MMILTGAHHDDSDSFDDYVSTSNEDGRNNTIYAAE